MRKRRTDKDVGGLGCVRSKRVLEPLAQMPVQSGQNPFIPRTGIPSRFHCVIIACRAKEKETERRNEKKMRWKEGTERKIKNKEPDLADYFELHRPLIRPPTIFSLQVYEVVQFSRSLSKSFLFNQLQLSVYGI